MPLFRYIAVDAQDVWQRGEESAADAAAVRTQLEMRGWKVTKIEEIHELNSFVEPNSCGRLSFDESATMAQRVLDISRLGLPLESGLRAVADDAPTRRLRSVLRAVAQELESGRSLESVLQRRKGQIPDPLLHLVHAGIETRTLALLLERYVQSIRRSAEIRRRMELGLAYPAIVALGSLAILIVFLVWIMPQFDMIFADFETDLPGLTAVVVGVSRVMRAYWGWLLLTGVLICGAALIGLLTFARSRIGRRAVCAIPVVGPLLRLTALAEFAHLLGQFLETRTELPNALELAGAGSGDAVIAWAANGLADEVRHGVSLADAASMVRGVPHPMRQMLRWSTHPQRFAEALFSASEMCLARASVQATVVGPFLEPFALFGAGALFGIVVISVFLPLFKLLNDLS